MEEKKVTRQQNEVTQWQDERERGDIVSVSYEINKKKNNINRRRNAEDRINTMTKWKGKGNAAKWNGKGEIIWKRDNAVSKNKNSTLILRNTKSGENTGGD